MINILISKEKRYDSASICTSSDETPENHTHKEYTLFQLKYTIIVKLRQHDACVVFSDNFIVLIFF